MACDIKVSDRMSQVIPPTANIATYETNPQILFVSTFQALQVFLAFRLSSFGFLTFLVASIAFAEGFHYCLIPADIAFLREKRP